MSLVFVSGAARSGKSAWAETHAITLAGGRAPLVYIATALINDAEMRRRVTLHRAARKDKGFETLERHTDVEGAVPSLPPGAVVLLECLGTLLANEMFEGVLDPAAPDLAAPRAYDQKIFEDVLSLRAHVAHLLVVSNDIFSDGVTYDGPVEKYRQALGALHVKLAGAADLAVECAAGAARQMKPVLC